MELVELSLMFNFSVCSRAQDCPTSTGETSQDDPVSLLVGASAALHLLPGRVNDVETGGWSWGIFSLS